jgi:HK97 gp10 family phage protein
MAIYSAKGQAGLAAKIQGLREAKRAFQALPEATRDAMLGAVEMTASELVRAAKATLQANPSIRTRSLYNALAYRVTKTNGRAKVGVGTGSTTGLFSAGTGVAGELKRRRIKGYLHGEGARTRLVRPDFYAKFVEFGTRRMPAEPFMIPSAEGQKGPFLDRCKAAGRKIEQNVAAVGARTL